MKPSLLLLLPALAAALAAADGTTSSIAFSDPNRPGTLRILIGQGSVAVRGTDTSEIRIRSSVSPKDRQPERKDGLRIISTASGYSLSEKDNVVELSAGLEVRGRGAPVRFDVEIPRTAALTVTNSRGGDITVEQVGGDVEIKNLGGEIVLSGLGGGALVETLNGRIEATFPALPVNKPLSFTSMNGEIQLRVPASAGANVRFRTQNGNVLTDFDEGVLVTQTQAMPSSATEEMARAAAETARAAAETARAAAEAVREKLEAVVADQVARQRETAERRTEVQRITERPGGSASATATASASATPKPPKPPRPPSIPSLSGGKVVTGTLNGGGVEIQAATMNGDIVLRKNTP